jgi:prevent-host-death family protein
MVIYYLEMDISVTDFKAHCLDLIRKVEAGGKAITIRRHGRVVARLEAASDPLGPGKPWEQLRALGGQTRLKASESVVADKDFQALR